MSAHAHATPHDDPASHAARTPDTHADAPCYRQALHDLIEIGTAFACLAAAIMNWRLKVKLCP